MPYDILIDDLGFELDDDAESELGSPFNEYGELIEWEGGRKPSRRKAKQKRGIKKGGPL